MMSSLSARLLIAVSLVLAVFFGVTVLVLDTVFRNAAEDAVEDRLDVQLFLLLAEAEPERSGIARLVLPDDLPEPRFSTAGSGLYGQINDAGGTPVWRSQSAVGTVLPMTGVGQLGERVFGRTQLADGRPVFLHTLKVEWEFENGTTAGYQFGVAESLDPFVKQMERYRRQLFGWFAGLAVALVLILGVLLRWVLSPLRKIEREISAVETGAQSQLSDAYPRELQGLTQNTNRLIQAEHARLERYRNTLGNLAHSLKTPLAVIRSSIEGQRDDQEIENQLGRMDEIIGYQLNRAATSGGVTLGHKPVDVAETIARVVRSLDKVYADKAPATERQIAAESVYFGDSGDLTEIVGNLVDNAYKYCKRHVRVSARPIAVGTGQHRPGLELVIEDDGAGIAPADAKLVFDRGVRIDEQADGQGIGLAVVREIVELCGGELEIARSDLGGASIAAVFPPG